MWSAVCSSALQFAEGTKPHLCIVERNSSMPVHRWCRLTQEGLGKVISGGEGLTEGINVCRQEVFLCHSVFHLWSAQKAAVVLDLSVVSAQAVQNGTLI